MRELHCPKRITEIKQSNRLAGRPVLHEEGNATKAVLKRATEERTETKTERQPKKKDRKKYAILLTAAMMVMAIISQASVLVGCAKNLVETRQNPVPTVTIQDAQVVDDFDTNDNESFRALPSALGGSRTIEQAPPPKPESPDSSSNQSWGP